MQCIRIGSWQWCMMQFWKSVTLPRRHSSSSKLTFLYHQLELIHIIYQLSTNCHSKDPCESWRIYISQTPLLVIYILKLPILLAELSAYDCGKPKSASNKLVSLKRKKSINLSLYNNTCDQSSDPKNFIWPEVAQDSIWNHFYFNWSSQSTCLQHEACYSPRGTHNHSRCSLCSNNGPSHVRT